MNKRTISTMTAAVLVLCLGVPTPLAAQSRDDERARREAEEHAAQQAAEKREQASKEQQKKAEEQMRKAERQMREAEREMERAARQMAELQASRHDVERELRRFAFFGNRVRLGVVVDPAADPETDPIGARIVAVTPGGAAEDAGLKAGDIITKVNGERLSARRSDAHAEGEESGPVNRLLEMIGDLEDGDQVAIEYRRDKDTRTATVKARAVASPELRVLMDRDFAVPATPDLPALRALVRGIGSGWLETACSGLEMVPLNPELGRYFGSSEGILVVSAPADSRLKLSSGDVILSIDGREPGSPSKFLRILRSYEPGETVTINVMRDKRPLVITVDVPENHASLVVPFSTQSGVSVVPLSFHRTDW